MNKIIILFLAVFSIIILIGCETDSNFRPDLEGKQEPEIRAYFEDKGWDVEFQYRVTDVREESNVFISYLVYDENSQYAEVIVSATIIDEKNFFEPVDMEYDGPRLDPSFFDMEYYTYDEEEGRYIGGGGAFEVTYEDGRWADRTGGCIDGDTTVFTYPEEIYERIESNTPSVRYLNMDTTETWPPGEEEEWGQPATQYVCDVLANAESIVLQTDPGDNLLGNYGRLLAWVWVIPEGEDEYELLNYNVVRQGLAFVAFEFGAGETDVTKYDSIHYNEWMHLAESRAKEEGRGMYSEDLKDPYWDYDNDAPHPERWPS